MGGGRSVDWDQASGCDGVRLLAIPFAAAAALQLQQQRGLSNELQLECCQRSAMLDGGMPLPLPVQSRARMTK